MKMKQTLLNRPLGSLIRLDWEKALYIILIILALTTRLWGLGDRVQSHDESLHTQYSWYLYAGRGFQHTPMMHGPFLFHATALSYFLLGDNDFTARLPVALIGVALVAFPYLLRRWLGRTGALITSFLLLISPSIAYYSRYIRHDIPIILWSLIVIYAVFSYLHDGRKRWLYLMAAGIALMFATKEVAFIYNAIIGLFLVGLFAFQLAEYRWSRRNVYWYFMIALAAAGLGLALLLVGVLQAGEEGLPPWWTFTGGMLAVLALATAAFILITQVGRDLYTYRCFDLIIVLGTLCLPLFAPVPIRIAGLKPLDYTAPTFYYSAAITGALLLISAGIGLAWDRRRWSVVAAVYYAIFIVLFTTVFTNGTGIASGMVGSLGYWLVQQEVERGGQPWYYYLLVMVPLYEYLPLLLTLISPIYLAIRPRSQNQPSATRDSQFSILNSRFLPFLLWWTALAWIAYSYAGEKMPWLTVHLALPMILLGGWLVGRLIEGTDWRQVLQRRAWLLAFIVPPFVVALVMLIKTSIAGPFQGQELAQLNLTGQFLGGLIGTFAFGAGLVYLIRHSGWRVSARILSLVAVLLLVLLTIRTTHRFCYVNYDYPTEFLVYAHAGPAVGESMRQIEELSRHIAGGPNLIKVAYGSDGSWPFNWYLRNYPNAVFYGEQPSREQMDAPVVIAGRQQWEAVAPYMGSDYAVNTYTFLWWPMEDYKDMTWARLTHAITDTQTRAALWDIWYDRDYRRYDELTGKTHTLDQWPLHNDYRLYVRHDVAAQTWNLGTSGPLEIGPTDPYAEGWRELTARLVFGGDGSEPGQLQNPRGINVGPDGFVYVTDGGNQRIQKFSATGEFVAVWGGPSTIETEAGLPQGFNDPWDVAVAPDGHIYVADTWNHRIQKLDAGGNPV
ncbi:MAG: TIGR03663 family protein, partial [Chloroflexota bacterium]|nr:TIGR03663 family protein [Chloroflexota bacterium]